MPFYLVSTDSHYIRSSPLSHTFTHWKKRKKKTSAQIWNRALIYQRFIETVIYSILQMLIKVLVHKHLHTETPSINEMWSHHIHWHMHWIHVFFPKIMVSRAKKKKNKNFTDTKIEVKVGNRKETKGIVMNRLLKNCHR